MGVPGETPLVLLGTLLALLSQHNWPQGGPPHPTPVTDWLLGGQVPPPDSRGFLPREMWHLFIAYGCLLQGSYRVETDIAWHLHFCHHQNVYDNNVPTQVPARRGKAVRNTGNPWAVGTHHPLSCFGQEPNVWDNGESVSPSKTDQLWWHIFCHSWICFLKQYLFLPTEYQSNILF